MECLHYLWLLPSHHGSSVIETDTNCVSSKSKIFSVWPSMEKVCQPCWACCQRTFWILGNPQKCEAIVFLQSQTWGLGFELQQHKYIKEKILWFLTFHFFFSFGYLMFWNDTSISSFSAKICFCSLKQVLQRTLKNPDHLTLSVPSNNDAWAL